MMEGFGKGLGEFGKKVRRDLALPNLTYGLFDLAVVLGGEAADTEQVVWSGRVHSCGTEGDGFRGPDFSVKKDLSLHFREIVDEKDCWHLSG